MADALEPSEICTRDGSANASSSSGVHEPPAQRQRVHGAVHAVLNDDGTVNEGADDEEASSIEHASDKPMSSSPSNDESVCHDAGAASSRQTQVNMINQNVFIAPPQEVSPQQRVLEEFAMGMCQEASAQAAQAADIAEQAAAQVISRNAATGSTSSVSNSARGSATHQRGSAASRSSTTTNLACASHRSTTR